MGLFKKKAKSETMTLNALLDFLNLHDVRGDALSEATYFACIKVLSESVGKLPIQLIEITKNKGVKMRVDHELFSAVRDRPNPYMTATSFWSTVEFARNHYGNAYVWIKRSKEGTTLWLLPTDEVQVWYDNRNLLAECQDIYYVWSSAQGMIPFKSEEILHFKTSNTKDGLLGISVRTQLAQTLAGGIKAQKFINKMYESGFTAKAVLQYTGDLNDENTIKFTKGIEQYARGELREKGIENIIPIPVGSQLTPLNVKLADNQFLEVKQYTALQIAAAFGIKPYQIGDYTKSSYSSAEQQQLSFYVDTMLYIIKGYEEELTYKLLTDKERAAGMRYKFNVSEILRVSFDSLIDTLGKAVSNGIYTPNEAREFVDKEAKQNCDKLLINGTFVPVERCGVQYGADPEGKEGK